MRGSALAAAVFLLAGARSLADGFGLGDESWFLQVVSRLRSGDVLYRDVFFGSTPLSMYVTTGLTFLTGVEVIAVKIVTNACFAVTTVLTGRLARQAGLSPLMSWLLMGAVFVWGRPYANPPYTPMATMFFVATLSASLAGAGDDSRGARSWTTWLGVGSLAGLSFASKQNIGLLALVTVFGVLAGMGRAETRLGPPPSRRQAGLSVAAGFAVTTAAVLAPVLASGGLAGLWEYGFAAKGAYVRVGGVSFLDSVRGWLESVSQVPTTMGLAEGLHGIVVVLPIAVLAAVIAAARQLDRRGWMLVIFAAAATATAFPRWDRFHMAYAVPTHLLALSYAVSRHELISQHAGLRRLATAAVLTLVLVVAVQPLVIVAREHRRPASLPFFRGVMMPPAEEARLAAAARRLRNAAAGRPVFILSTDAGFWYLSSDVDNPTPFDIPVATAVGSSGATWLRTELAHGGIDQVRLDNGPPNRLTLDAVRSFARDHFEPGPDIGPCTIFMARNRSHEQERRTR